MNAFWHPAIRADWLVLRRTGPMAFVRILGASVLLLACCVALACGDFYEGYGWCLVAAILFALGGSYAIAHARLMDAQERWRFGWCGALPTARGATAYTLLLVATAALAASLAFVTALLLGVSIGAPHRGDLAYALAGIELALVVGTMAATVRVFSRGAFAVRQADGIREPLLALPWLNDPRLPHLLDWQRRAALVRWRRGGGFVMVVIVLGAVPMGAPMLEVAALVLLVLSWSWLRVVMRASADATDAAVHLLRATPLDVRRAHGFVSLSERRRSVRAAADGGRRDIAGAWRDRVGVGALRRRDFGMAARSNPSRDAQSGIAGMTALLRAANLRVSYGDVRVLDGIDLEIAHGEFVALIGPNGAGKTTLLHAIAGVVPLRGGSVAIAGHDLAKAPRDAKNALGLAVEPAQLPELLTGRECLALFAGARGLPAIPPATLALGETLSMTSVLDRRVASYSLGMRQKLGILLGLIGEPPLLLLDEPLNGLDPRSALAFKTHLAVMVTRGDTSMLLATHSLDIAERHATRIVLLIDGRVRHTWNATELAAMREYPERSLEQAMAEACGA